MSHLNRRPSTTCALLLVCLLFGLGLPVGVSGAAVAAEDPRALDARAVDAYLQDQVDAGLPGVAVAITRGDRVLFVRGYGHDSAGARIGEETPFRIASLSKSFTALAVMQLVEDGRLGLDDPVAEHLSAFSPDDPRADEITVRQLLSQTSGMADRAISRDQRATTLNPRRGRPPAGLGPPRRRSGHPVELPQPELSGRRSPGRGGKRPTLR